MDLAASVQLFAVGRFLQGLAMGVFRVAMAMLVERRFAQGRVVRAQSILNRVNAVTGPLVVIAAGFTTGRMVAWVQLALTAVALAAVFWVQIEDYQSTSAPVMLPQRGRGALWRVPLGGAFYLMWLALFWALIASQYRESAGLQFFVAAGTYALLSGVVVERLLPRWRLHWAIGPALGTLALGIGLWVPQPYQLAAAALFGAAHAPVWPTLQRWIPRDDPQVTTAGQRLLALGSDLGQAAGLALGHMAKASPLVLLGLMAGISLLGLENALDLVAKRYLPGAEVSVEENAVVLRMYGWAPPR